MVLCANPTSMAASKQVAAPASVLCAKQISTCPRCGAPAPRDNGLHCMLDVGPGSESMRPEQQTVLHSWCKQTEWDAPVIVGGAGAYLFVADGRRILDMSSLAECSNLGHQHPRVVAAIRTQAANLCFVTNAWGAEPRAELAELLLEKSGFHA